MELANKLAESYEANQQIAKKLPAQYNLTDLVIPFKLLRHVPKILKENNKIIKGYELIVLGILQAVQIVGYTSLYHIISNR